MTVYVDDAQIPYGRMLMCHMVADSPAELHEMADRIGIRRRWYQARSSLPHYDICLAKRRLAVSAGAVEVSRREMGRLLPRLRAAFAPGSCSSE